MEAQTRHEPNRIGEMIELNEGEELCNKCEGTGYDANTGGFFNPICSKCQGEKKLDWISKITGVAPKPSIHHGSSYFGTYSTSGPGHTHSIPYHSHAHSVVNTQAGSITISPAALAPARIVMDSEYLDIDDKPIKKYVEEIVAEKLAKEIDKQIIRSLSVQKEQNKNEIKGRKFFGNGIISKLMLLCDPKQRFRRKSKKD